MSWPFEASETGTLTKVFLSLIILGVVAVVEVVIRTIIKRFCRGAGIKRHVENWLKIVARIITWGFGLGALLPVWGISTDWLVSVSALTGAVIGFASMQTVGNMFAGLYIMITRPFEAGHLVRIGDSEGQVREITLGYTRLLTPTEHYMYIPNTQVLNSRVLNFTYEDHVEYPVVMYFPHDMSLDTLQRKVIEPVIQSFHKEHESVFLKPPTASVTGMEHFRRAVSIRLFYTGSIREFYDLVNELIEGIMAKWDAVRTA